MTRRSIYHHFPQSILMDICVSSRPMRIKFRMLCRVLNSPIPALTNIQTGRYNSRFPNKIPSKLFWQCLNLLEAKPATIQCRSKLRWCTATSISRAWLKVVAVATVVWCAAIILIALPSATSSSLHVCPSSALFMAFTVQWSQIKIKSPLTALKTHSEETIFE